MTLCLLGVEELAAQLADVPCVREAGDRVGVSRAVVRLVTLGYDY